MELDTTGLSTLLSQASSHVREKLLHVCKHDSYLYSGEMVRPEKLLLCLSTTTLEQELTGVHIYCYIDHEMPECIVDKTRVLLVPHKLVHDVEPIERYRDSSHISILCTLVSLGVALTVPTIPRPIEERKELAYYTLLQHTEYTQAQVYRTFLQCGVPLASIDRVHAPALQERIVCYKHRREWDGQTRVCSMMDVLDKAGEYIGYRSMQNPRLSLRVCTSGTQHRVHVEGYMWLTLSTVEMQEVYIQCKRIGVVFMPATTNMYKAIYRMAISSITQDYLSMFLGSSLSTSIVPEHLQDDRVKVVHGCTEEEGIELPLEVLKLRLDVPRHYTIDSTKHYLKVLFSYRAYRYIA